MSQQVPSQRIVEQLDRLLELWERREERLAAYAAQAEAVLSATARRKLQQIEQARQIVLGPLQAEIDLQEEAIRSATLGLQGTVKGRGLMAVYSSGRITWNTAALDGYIAAGHPELAPFRQAGAPSVALRRLGASRGHPGKTQH